MIVIDDREPSPYDDWPDRLPRDGDLARWGVLLCLLSAAMVIAGIGYLLS